MEKKIPYCILMINTSHTTEMYKEDEPKKKFNGHHVETMDAERVTLQLKPLTKLSRNN